MSAITPPRPTNRALTDSDALVWIIERDPELRSTITGVLYLEHAPAWPALRARVARGVRATPRLRQLIVASLPDGGAPVWVDAEQMDLDAHLQRVRAADPPTRARVMELVEQAAMTAFDPARPLWSLTLVEGLEGGEAALVVKIHHAITDGIGALQLAANLLDLEPEAGDRDTDETLLDPATASGTPSRAANMTEAAAGRLGVATDQLRLGVQNALGFLGQAVRDPRTAASGLATNVRNTAGLVAPVSARCSPLFVGNSLSLRMHTLEVPLEGLKASGRVVGGSLNDAFLAAVTGGLGAYHRALGVTVEALRVTLPVNIRRDDDSSGGNRFTPLRFEIPVDVGDPVTRMRALRGLSRERRDPAVLAVTDSLASVLNSLPPAVVSAVFGSMLKGVDLVASNVPGSPFPLYLAGARATEFYAFAPPTGAALSITLLSHVDQCGVGIAANPDCVPDIPLLVRCLQEAFDEVLELGERLPPEPRPAEAVEAPPGLPDRLSALDQIFLEAESERTPMHIGALAVLDGTGLLDAGGHVRIDALRRTIASRLDTLPRYRQRLLSTAPFARPLWVDDEAFDIAHHVVAEHLDPGAGPADLLELFERVQMVPLDRGRPLWQLIFVDGVAGGQVGWIWKVHHAMVDGLAGVASLLALLQAEPEHRLPPESDWTPAPPPPSAGLVATLTQASDAAIGALRSAARVTTHPGDVGHAVSGLSPLLSNLPTAPASSLNQQVGSARRYRVLDQSLASVKAVKSALGGTVNDVVLTAVAGGLHELLDARGEASEGALVRVGVPKASRDVSGAVALGNRVAGLFLSVPVGPMGAVERYQAVRSATEAAKDTDMAEAGQRLTDFADSWPTPIVRTLAGLVHRQPFVNLIVTNVPGPQVPLYLLASRMERLWPYVPLGGNLTVGVAIVSYDGTLSLGITGDVDAVPDLDVLCSGIARTFRELEVAGDA